MSILTTVTEVPDRMLTAHPGDILDRVRSGEEVVVTADGAPVAEIRPVGRPPGLGWDAFWTRLEVIPSDASFAADIRDITADPDEDSWR